MTHLNEKDVIGRIDSLTVERLDLYVSHGWITQHTDEPERHFADIDLARLQLIEHLRTDMALGDEAVPVVLSLIDQIHGLRHQLRCVGQAIEAQEETVRTKVLEALRTL